MSNNRLMMGIVFPCFFIFLTVPDDDDRGYKALPLGRSTNVSDEPTFKEAFVPLSTTHPYVRLDSSCL